MISNKLNAYISIISNGSILPVDDYIGGPEEKLIYKFIATFKDESRDKFSNKFIKKLINKIRLLNPIAREKTEVNRYVVNQYTTNELRIIEFVQGDLKDRYKG